MVSIGIKILSAVLVAKLIAIPLILYWWKRRLSKIQNNIPIQELITKRREEKEYNERIKSEEGKRVGLFKPSFRPKRDTERKPSVKGTDSDKRGEEQPKKRNKLPMASSKASSRTKRTVELHKPKPLRP